MAQTNPELKYLTDIDDRIFYPVTNQKAVVDDNGTSLDTIINNINPDILESITYSELKNKRDSGQLIPGMQYKITDYVATVSHSEARSANHPFDIILTALDTNKLSEEGRAEIHEGDTYFSTSDLSSWKVWYSLDNDTARFNWADSANGKGVVYRLIDEWNNDIAYDFKSIQFKRYKVTPTQAQAENLADLSGMYIGQAENKVPGLVSNLNDSIWCYTFSNFDSNLISSSDGSLLGHSYCSNNKVDSTYSETLQNINNVVICFGNAVSQWFTQFDANINMGKLVQGIDFDSLSHDTTLVGRISVMSGNCFNAVILGFCEHNTDLYELNESLIFAKRKLQNNHLGNIYKSIIVGKTIIGNNVYGAFTENVIVSSNEIYGNSFLSCSHNTIKVTSSNLSVCDFSYFTYNTITGTSIYTIKLHNAVRNTITCNGQIYNINGEYHIEDNTFTVDTGIASVYLGSSFRNNTINGQYFLYVNCVGGDVRNSQFNSVCSCNFYGRVRYITIPAVQDKTFIGCDIYGVRGDEGNNVILNYSKFYDYDDRGTINNIAYRISIVKDENHSVVAKWLNNGQTIGVVKAPNSSEWVPIADETTSNKVTTITASSTDIEYPSAKAVYDMVNGMLKDITVNVTGSVQMGKVVGYCALGKNCTVRIFPGPGYMNTRVTPITCTGATAYTVDDFNGEVIIHLVSVTGDVEINGEFLSTMPNIT